LLKKCQDVFQGQIDFEGQKQTEYLTTVMLSVTGIVAFLVGIILQNIYLTLWIGLGGTLLTFIVVVPPYPAYNANPEKWLPASGDLAGSGFEIDGIKLG